MHGIKNIGVYIPEGRESNQGMEEKFGLREGFVSTKIGVENRAIKDSDDDVKSMCLKAFEDLRKREKFEVDEIDVIVLVTQNPDFGIPHTSAVLHEALGAREQCICFDISHGCAGFVYGLSIINSFMASNGYKKGLLFTCDPYSKIVNPDDKDTAMIFGDAATASLISSDQPLFSVGKFHFGTFPGTSLETNTLDGVMYMNGRKVYNLAVKYIPASFNETLKLNELSSEDLDYCVLHQGSRYIVDSVIGRIDCPAEKFAYDIKEYGNTVSSTIPLILARTCLDKPYKKIFISGFGVGLSWGSTVLSRSGE